jgi:dTDP-4-dehydrorhamnose 3,5-epimerase
MSVEVVPLEIPEVKLITPHRHGDHRGWFCETWNRAALAEHGITLDFVQDNHSFSAQRGTLRGLHYQSAPFAQDKLVRVSRGSILDVAVDIRQGSPTFGKYVSAVLKADVSTQILVPVGFAHGFVTLEPDTEVQYKVSAPYGPQNDHGIAWNDPAIGINWPLPSEGPQLSGKDAAHPLLADAPVYFTYGDA